MLKWTKRVGWTMKIFATIPLVSHLQTQSQFAVLTCAELENKKSSNTAFPDSERRERPSLQLLLLKLGPCRVQSPVSTARLLHPGRNTCCDTRVDILWSLLCNYCTVCLCCAAFSLDRTAKVPKLHLFLNRMRPTVLFRTIAISN